MHINVRFWDPVENEVCIRNFTSAFLGKTKAVDLLGTFKNSLDDFSLEKMVQVSMDVPNVNLRFFKGLKTYLKTLENQAALLDIGSCGLHVCHNSYKGAIIATTWDIVQFLRCVYNIFKDVPTRRALYIEYTQSNLFSLKFGATTRWLENEHVAGRALDMLPSLRKFVISAKENKTEPTSTSYTLVKEC